VVDQDPDGNTSAVNGSEVTISIGVFEEPVVDGGA